MSSWLPPFKMAVHFLHGFVQVVNTLLGVFRSHTLMAEYHSSQLLAVQQAVDLLSGVQLSYCWFPEDALNPEDALPMFIQHLMVLETKAGACIKNLQDQNKVLLGPLEHPSEGLVKHLLSTPHRKSVETA